jgi:hypothetical protein
MKKLFLMFASVSILASCGSSSDQTSTTDSTTVVAIDSTHCDSTKCDTTKTCCKDSVAVDTTKH